MQAQCPSKQQIVICDSKACARAETPIFALQDACLGDTHAPKQLREAQLAATKRLRTSLLLIEAPRGAAR